MILIRLVLGTFMDLAPLIIICTPIFLPVAKAIGVDPVHFGVILILRVALTPVARSCHVGRFVASRRWCGVA